MFRASFGEILDGFGMFPGSSGDISEILRGESGDVLILLEGRRCKVKHVLFEAKPSLAAGTGQCFIMSPRGPFIYYENYLLAAIWTVLIYLFWGGGFPGISI